MTEKQFDAMEVDYRNSDYIPPDVQDGFWGRVRMVADLVNTVRSPHDGMGVVDLGCNAGHLLELFGQPCWGYDIAESPLAVGLGAGHDVRSADIMVDNLELAPIVVISEVLEHLESPHKLIERVNVDPVRYVVASSPFGEDELNHYEQHCWAWDLEGFAKMFLEQDFAVTAQLTNGHHQAILAERV